MAHYLDQFLSGWGYTSYNIVRGGSSYNSSGITVGSSGFYFVFGQLQLNPSRNSLCGFKLKKGGNTLSHIVVATTEGAYDRTEYTGRVVWMSRGEQIKMACAHGCNFANHFDDGSFIGAFYLPFQTKPTIHLPVVTSSYGGTTWSRGIKIM